MEKSNEPGKPRLKKVLIATDLKPVLMQGESFLNRTDIKAFFVKSNDEMLNRHIEEKMDVIVMKLDMPGHQSEEIFDIIWQSKKLREVLVILLCEDNVTSGERSKRCGAGAVLTLPVDPAQLFAKVRQFLNVAPRQSYRVLLNISVEGKFENRSFLCKTENISSSGMLILADMDLAAGNAMACSFFLPDGKKIVASGEVMRTVESSGGGEGKLYGIRFSSIKPDAKSAIEAYVERELLFNH